MSYEYPEADGEDAQPEVQEAVERWREEVPDEVKQDQALLYWLLNGGTPNYKMDKEDADYVHEPQGAQKCGNCEYGYLSVEDGKMICSKVQGKVKANHWCRLWEKGENYNP